MATTGMGCSAQDKVGTVNENVTIAVADAKTDRREVMVVLSSFKIAARQVLSNCAPHRTKD